MGFFSGSTTVQVSSTVYNLAGDEALRPNFLKTSVIGAVLSSDSSGSITDQVTSNYLNGPGIKIRQFDNWCSTSGYTSFVGMSASALSLPGTIDSTTLAGQIPHTSGQTVALDSSAMGLGDYSYWVDQWVMNNNPSANNTAYTSTLNTTTNVVTLTYVDHTTTTFTISGYDPTKRYIYAMYSLIDTATSTPGPKQGFIYQQGTGNTTLDAMFTTSSTGGDFIPYIPIRINNKFLSSTYMPDVYSWSEKAYKRATGTRNLDSLITKIAQNPNLTDIDYAYIVYGVSLNVQEIACRRYIYEFFLEIMRGQDLTGSGFNTLLSQWQTADQSMQNFRTWANNNYANPGHAGPQPSVIPYPTMSGYTVKVDSSNKSILDFDFRIIWSGILESTGTGLAKPGAKADDLWFDTSGTVSLTQTIYLGTPTSSPPQFSTVDRSQGQIRLIWQVTNNSWRSLTIYGLTHYNYIYSGVSVTITGPEALAATHESGFIIPLHTGILKKLPITISTQMATASTFLVFNAYKLVTSPWYTSGFFKIILAVAVIAVSVATAGVADVGILGSAAAIGSGLGFTGLTASIVGAIANAVAAMVLVQVIQAGSIILFGPRLGAIIGAISGLIALQVGTTLMNGGSLLSSFDSLMRVDNLMGLTDALGKGFAGYLGAETNDILKQTSDLMSSFGKQAKEFESKYDTLIGTRVFDPLNLSDVSVPDVAPKLQIPSEMPRGFFDRTLMSGSDICKLSHSMVADFTKIMLNSELVLS